MTEKTKTQYDMILSFMKDDMWYNASEISEILGVKETRTKELLRNLCAEGILVDNDKIRGRRYKKKV